MYLSNLERVWLVKQCVYLQTPIVNEKFIYDCIERRKILETDGYVLR